VTNGSKPQQNAPALQAGGGRFESGRLHLETGNGSVTSPCRWVGQALATGLGAVPVFFIGERAAALRPALIGLAVGLMSVASVVGLLIPALEEGSLGSVAAGLFGGAVFLLMTKLALAKRDVHVGKLRGARVRQSVLVFAVLFVHSLPEGMAMGTAWASERAGLGLFVVLAIALQNIPEGTPPDSGGGRCSGLLQRRARRSPSRHRSPSWPSRACRVFSPLLRLRGRCHVDARRRRACPRRFPRRAVASRGPRNGSRGGANARAELDLGV
jgi:hypothetical protein